MVNGFRFQTKDLESIRRTQNSGVMVRGDDSDSNKEYYGVLEDIYQLSYMGNRKVYLFRCHWWHVAHLGKGYKIDKYDFINVNTRCVLNTNEPFVLASQSEQVFYVNDMIDKDWLVILKTSPRDLFNVPEKDDNSLDVEDKLLTNEEAYQQEEVEFTMEHIDNQLDDIFVSLHRNDVEPESISCNQASEQAQTSMHNGQDSSIYESEESEEELLDDNEGEDIDTED